MKKIELKQLEILNGGCMRFIRRHNREAAKGSAASEDLMESYLYAFELCIDKKYS